MFVVCAQAPGRIDGVLVVLVVEVLITTHSACRLMRAARKELAQLACHNGRSSAPGAKSKKPSGSHIQTANITPRGLLGHFLRPSQGPRPMDEGR